MKEKILFINNLTLKIIAIILMSLSHIGIFLVEINSLISTLFLSLGSLAFPLFIFLLIEGINKTTNIKKYLLRLVLLAFIIFIAILSFSFVPSLDSYNIYQFGNIFIDLSLFVLIYYLYKINKNYSYPLIGLIFIYFIITYLIKINIINLDLTIYKILGGLFPQYSLFGLLLFLLTIISFHYYEKRIEKIDINFKETASYKFSKNAIYSIILALFSLISYLFTYTSFSLGSNNVYSTYIILASIFILFYNYKKGYQSKLVQYFFYLYYPLHIVIIFLIFTFIF